jgi:hypothetical protein
LTGAGCIKIEAGSSNVTGFFSIALISFVNRRMGFHTEEKTKKHKVHGALKSSAFLCILLCASLVLCAKRECRFQQSVIF